MKKSESAILLTLFIMVFIVGNVSALTLIKDCQGLQDIKNNLLENYEIVNNIDCSDTVNWNEKNGFEPIKNFGGVLDGKGFTISDLYMRTTYIGMFYGLNKNPTIKNLNFVNAIAIIENEGDGGILFNGGITSSSQEALVDNVSIQGSVYGGTTEYTGGFGGFHSGEKDIISNSHFTGYVEGAGGFIGQSDGIIINCSFSGDVNGTGVDIWWSGPNCVSSGYIDCVPGLTGGFIGWNYGTIESSYSKGTVKGINNVGGFVGGNENYGPIYPANIIDSYSTSEVRGLDYKGGFVGYNVGGDVVNCYSTGEVISNSIIGGFLAYLGNQSGDYECYDSFWDNETSGLTTSACDVMGKTTAQMQDQITYVGWDFDKIWCMMPLGYPYLKWEKQDEDGDCIGDGDDICPETPLDTEVDINGCSVTQFCNQFNPLGDDKKDPNRKACIQADWKDNEEETLVILGKPENPPGKGKGRKEPEDCYIEKNNKKDLDDDLCMVTDIAD